MGNTNFEKVDNFKYLGVNINSNNNMYKIHTYRNKCYFSIQKLLRLKLLSRKSKVTLYTRYLKPICM